MAKLSKLHTSLTRREQAVGWFYLIFEIFFLPGILDLCSSFLPVPLSKEKINFVYFSLNFIAILLIFHRFLLNSMVSASHNFWIFLQASVLGLAAYWASSRILTFLIQMIDPSFYNVNDSGMIQMVKNAPSLMFIGTVILVPAAEECLYRGLIFLGLYRKSRLAAYAVSVICFSLIHIIGYLDSYNPILLLLCFLQYLPAGIWLAWTYEKSGSIFAPMLVHSIVNAIGILRLR